MKQITRSSGVTASVPASTSHDNISKICPQFRKLEKGEDIEAYFGAFETHMTSYGVQVGQWARCLATILTPEANMVYMSLSLAECTDYAKLKEALYEYYSVTRETYREILTQ